MSPDVITEIKRKKLKDAKCYSADIDESLVGIDHLEEVGLQVFINPVEALSFFEKVKLAEKLSELDLLSPFAGTATPGSVGGGIEFLVGGGCGANPADIMTATSDQVG